jgi:hypothetical protein
MGARRARPDPALAHPARAVDAVHPGHGQPGGRRSGVGAGPRPPGDPGRQPRQPRGHAPPPLRPSGPGAGADGGGSRRRLLVPSPLAGSGGRALAEHLPLLSHRQRAGGPAPLQHAAQVGVEPADLPGGDAIAPRGAAGVQAGDRVPGDRDPHTRGAHARPGIAPDHAEGARLPPAGAGPGPHRTAPDAHQGRGVSRVHRADRERGPSPRQRPDGPCGGRGLDRPLARHGPKTPLGARLASPSSGQPVGHPGKGRRQRRPDIVTNVE